MTSGSLWKNIFFFSVPLMFSQLLEVMFNFVAVVGQFADYKALGQLDQRLCILYFFLWAFTAIAEIIYFKITFARVTKNEKI